MKKYTEEEVRNIVTDYNDGMKPFELAKKYKRNSSSIINKLKSIGVFNNVNYRFTEDDIEFLRNVYPTGDWDKITKRFPNVSRQSILSKVSKLNIKTENYFWTKEDELFLKDNYYIMDLDDIFQHYNGRHSKAAIQTKALKCFNYYNNNYWTESENEILRKYYPIEPMEDVQKRLQNRSLDAIINHAKILGITSLFTNNTYWNNEQTEILLANWEAMSDTEIGILVGKPKESVKERRCRLGLLRIDRDNLTYSDLNKYLRGQISDWKNESMIACDYQCILTGSKDFQIHHLYSFNKMIKDMFARTGIIEKKFSEYTRDELEVITKEFIVEQSKHPLGVCISKNIHDLYHNIYGKMTNTPEQWACFYNDYKNGLYKDIA